MFARDVMSRDVVSVSASTTAFDAAKLLLNSRLTAVPVIDDSGAMIGIVSEADLIGKARESGEECRQRCARQSR